MLEGTSSKERRTPAPTRFNLTLVSSYFPDGGEIMPSPLVYYLAIGAKYYVKPGVKGIDLRWRYSALVLARRVKRDAGLSKRWHY